MISVAPLYEVLGDQPHYYRKNIKRGMTVMIVEKNNQKTGILTRGIVDVILTNAPRHTRGIKVQLKTGEIGRVQQIIS
jgi:uncharacterized repeat protein (TIGR03833 family)